MEVDSALVSEVSVCDTQGKLAVTRNVRSLLNKVGSQQIKTISAQLGELDIQSEAELSAVAADLVEYAIRQPALGKFYCFILKEMESRRSARGASGLLDAVCGRCRHQFVQLLHKQVEVSSNVSASQPGRDHSKRCFLTSVRFASLLFVHGLASEAYLGELLRCLFRGRAAGEAHAVAEDEPQTDNDAAFDVFMLSGGRCATRGMQGDIAAMLVVRLSEELDTAANQLRLMSADGVPVEPSAPLCDAAWPLQVLVLPPTSTAWGTLQDDLVAALCAALEVLTDSLAEDGRKLCATALVPSSAPRRAATVQAAPTAIMPPCLVLPDGLLTPSSNSEARRRVIERCVAHILELRNSTTAGGKPKLSKRIQFMVDDVVGAAQLALAPEI